MVLEIRSQNGCWTCRVRKRKCDEMAPVCSECHSLRLDCHGQVDKPTWMDRGAKQKEQAAKIKQMVAEVRRQRRLSQIPGRHQISTRSSRSHSRNSHSRESSSSSSTSSCSTTASITPTTPKPNIAHELYPSPLSPKFFEHDNDYRFSSDDLNLDFFLTGTTSPGFQGSSEGIGYSMPNNYVFEDNYMSTHQLSLPPKDITPSYPGGSLVQGLEAKQCNAVSKTANNKPELVFDNIEDAISLAHYFEKVFNWQFQFCQLQKLKFNQGHILWLSSKSRSLYHAILALSSSYKSIWGQLEATSPSLSDNQHTPQYDLAIKELQNDLQDPKTYKETWLLACIVTFLHSTVWPASTLLLCHAYMTIVASIQV